MTAPVPETTIEPWVFRVSPFPAESGEGRFWSVWIRATGDGRWKILSGFNPMPEEYLDVTGMWTMDRDESTFHADFDEAKRLASVAILEITVNGLTIQDAAKRLAGRQA